VTLRDEGRGMSWGFSLGEISTRSVLRIDETGAWTEVTEIAVASEAPRRLLELVVQRSS
jgi:hypothetical protein